MNATGSKSIKLTQETYDKLDMLRGKGQTFSEIVDVLCEIGWMVKLQADTLMYEHGESASRHSAADQEEKA